MRALPHVGIGALSPARAEALLAGAAGAAPTYDHVGSTLDPGAPLDLDEARVLGTGDEVFARAVAFVRGLGPQRAIGAVWPEGAVAVEGATALVVPRFGPLALTALVRFVAVVDEPDRGGFVYGTLPGHPERGEEAFLVSRTADGEVTMRVAARSVPAVPGGRLLVPAVVPVQRHFARRYLTATAAAC